MIKNRDDLFLKDEKIENWFELDNEYDSLEVGFLREIPASTVTSFYLMERDSKKIEAMKESKSKDDKSTQHTLKLYNAAKEILRGIVCKCDGERLISDDALDNKLGIATTIKHCVNILKAMHRGQKENVKK